PGGGTRRNTAAFGMAVVSASEKRRSNSGTPASDTAAADATKTAAAARRMKAQRRPASRTPRDGSTTDSRNGSGDASSDSVSAHVAGTDETLQIRTRSINSATVS